ncbi:MAG: imelysin family protein [Hyphomicrobiaceae bacterium]
MKLLVFLMAPTLGQSAAEQGTKCRRRNTRAAITLALALVCAQPSSPTLAADNAFPHREVATSALEGHIRPGYDRFAAAAARFVSQTQQCQSRAAFEYEMLMPAFRELVMAWGRIAHISFGPVMVENRLERLYFWLDRKGIARRQVMAAIAGADPKVAAAQSLAQRSVGLQGLPALEFLVSGEAQRVAADRAHLCRFAIAIAQNVSTIAAEIAADWSPAGPWTRHWLAPGAGNPRFVSDRETTFALATSFLAQMTRVRDVELMRPLGFAARNRRLPGPFDRTGLTMVFLAARLEGLRSLVVDSGLLDAVSAIATATGDSGSEVAAQDARQSLDESVRLASRLSSIDRFFGTGRRREAIALGAPLKLARLQLETALQQTSDLPLGFNANDGD